MASALLGSGDLLGKEGPVSVSSLDGKYLLLYFSAHWCGPCRGFTPELAKFYTKLKQTRSDFDLVFVSSDRSEEEFAGYYKEMPWLALPFAQRNEKAALSKKFGVQGIPTLVVVDPQGNTITVDGREAVSSDPSGARFPWQPRSFSEIINGPLLANGTNQPTSGEELKNLPAFAIYFSAHWCGPCRAFTPLLTEAYKKGKEANPKMEIVFASSDQEEDAFDEYFKTMPWTAFPFGDPRIEELSSLFKVRGIPCLVTVAGDGTVINAKARGAVSSADDGAGFPWAPEPRKALENFEASEAIYETLQNECFILLDLSKVPSSDLETARATFTSAAAKIAESNATSTGPLRCLIAEPTAIAHALSEAENKKCPSGHALETVERKGARCDCCGGGIKGASNVCKQCDYDRCPECFANRTAPVPPSQRLLAQVRQVMSIPDAAVFGGAGRTGIAGSGQLTEESLLALAAATRKA